VIDELNTLVTTSFSGQVIDKVENLLEAIDVAEHESDIRQVGLRRALFEQEANMNPVNAVFLYQIIEKLGDIADDAQTVGNRMMNLIAS
jgi:predicted phosphate transport protein (TIGR00153 family)